MASSCPESACREASTCPARRHQPSRTRHLPTPRPMSRLTELLVNNRRWVVLGMLVALHAGLVSAPGSDFQRVWLLVHFGLFLLWQPFIAADRELDVVGAVLLFAITLATISFLAGWMIIGWLLVLLGILGGRVFTVQAQRRGRFY